MDNESIKESLENLDKIAQYDMMARNILGRKGYRRFKKAQGIKTFTEKIYNNIRLK